MVSSKKILIKELLYFFFSLLPLILYGCKYVFLKMPGLASVKPYEPSLGGWQMIRTLINRDLWISTLSMDNQILPRELEALGVVDLYNPYRLVVVLFVLAPVFFLVLAALLRIKSLLRESKERDQSEKELICPQGKWLPWISVVLLILCYVGLRFLAAPSANDQIREMFKGVTDPFVAERFGRVLSIDFGFGPAYYGALISGAAMGILGCIESVRFKRTKDER